MTPDERRLLVEINRWNRANGLLSRYRRRFMQTWDGRWQSTDREVEVCWSEDREPPNTISVTWKAKGYGVDRATFPASSVREAVDVLAALGVLPARFSSAFAAGYREGANDVPAGGPHVEPAPIQDPALAHHPGECCWLSVAPFSGGRYHASDCKGEHGGSS